MNTKLRTERVCLTVEDPGRLIDLLIERISDLERQLATRTRSSMSNDLIPDFVRGLLKYFRLHQIILLHVGNHDHARLSEAFRKEQHSDPNRCTDTANSALQASLEEVWYLSAAGLPSSVEGQVRAAANGGVSIWR